MNTLKKQLDSHIRWMIRRDMEAVMAIEAACFEFPWNEGDFIYSLRQRNIIGKVAEHRERVVGFFLYELFPRRIHVVNFCVHEDWRYKGVGRQLVEHLQGKLSSDKRNRLSLEIRESNLDAQLFFKAMGFECVETIRGHYEETPEDAYRFVYRYREGR